MDGYEGSGKTIAGRKRTLACPHNRVKNAVYINSNIVIFVYIVSPNKEYLAVYDNSEYWTNVLYGIK